MKNENSIKFSLILSDTNNLYPITLGVYKHDCENNMRAELSVFRIGHPKLCWHKHTVHFGMCFARARVWVKILIWEDFGL